VGWEGLETAGSAVCSGLRFTRYGFGCCKGYSGRAERRSITDAEKISERKDKRHLVFAPAQFVPNKMLLPLGVEYAPLPFALYRFERD